MSTYALDAVATACGHRAAGDRAPRRRRAPAADRASSSLTYVAWAAGLRVNLAANWRLLNRTGASTNALSKAGFDLARRRSPRVRRFAAGAGYVLTELVKEAPYYSGAFGAALATDSVSANDALVFLGGANLGAGLYEYGLARATTALLGRRVDARTAK